jgi:hypothetical protein
MHAAGKLRPAGMSRDESKWADDSYRGDEMTWLTLADGGTPPGPAVRKLLVRLQGLKEELIGLDQGNRRALALEGCHVSAQLAFYAPGKVRENDAAQGAPCPSPYVGPPPCAPESR